MIQINVQFTTQGKPLEEQLAIVDRLQNLAPIMDRVPEEVIFPSVERLFAMGGRPTWRFKGFQSSPPMVKSGLMKTGLTTRSPGLNAIAVTPNSVSFMLLEPMFRAASMVGDWGRRKDPAGFFYPAAHQFGTKKHNINEVLNLDEQDVARLEELLSDYVTDGKLGSK